jgi:hypothetical protein
MSTHSGSKTRKGVKANHPGIKLINITNDVEVRRIPRNIADKLVKTGEWRFCPKNFVIE